MLMMLGPIWGFEMEWETWSAAYADDAGLVFGFFANRKCG